jgi:hypothetical protein
LNVREKILLEKNVLKKGHIRIGLMNMGEHIDATEFGERGEACLNAFYNRMQIGDFLFLLFEQDDRCYWCYHRGQNGTTNPAV